VALVHDLQYSRAEAKSMKTKTNVKAGADKPVKYMTYTMKEVLITSVNPSS
jgi:hypothetical protein